jgi:hypothetical protein
VVASTALVSDSVARMDHREVDEVLLDLELEFARFRDRVMQELHDSRLQVAKLVREVDALLDRSGAVAFVLKIKGADMAGQITVDTTNETAWIDFVDDHGNTTAAPAGAVISFTSSDETVLTVAADATNPLQVDITPVGLGTASITASSNGTALEADGVTPIPDAAPVSVTVSAGAAAGESFTLST